MRPEELEDLVARFLGDSLSEEEERKLLDHLERSPESRDALGLELVVDRLLRESRKPPLAADRILKALPQGSRHDFAGAVMQRLPAGSPGRSPFLIPGLVAAGLLAALLLFSALQTSPAPAEKGDGPAAPRSGADIEARREVLEERTQAEADRRRTEEAVAALRRKEAEAVRERERAERANEEESRRHAEDELLRLKAEREAEEARFVEALERERRATAEAARPAPLLAKTETIAVTIEKADGRVTLLAGDQRTVVAVPRILLPGEGVETAVKNGSAVLTFADRTQVHLGSGTVIREVVEQGGKRLVVVRGRVTATVAKQPADQPFVLSTPHGEAKVVGTTLRLTVDPSGTRLEVTEGKVRLSRLDGKSVDVPSGHCAVAAAGLELASRPMLDRLHYEAAVAKRPDLLFFEDFEQEGWKRHWSSPSATSRVTEERAFTLVGRRALEVRFKAGEKGGDGWHRLTMSNGASKMHVRAYFFFPKDFDLGADGSLSLMKVGALPTGAGVQEGMSLWADHRPNGRDFFSADLLLTSRWTLQFGYYHPDQTGPKGDWKDGETPGAISLKPGSWHSIELLCQANDPGQKNGMLCSWIDGTLCGQEIGIRFREAETLQIREVALTGGGSPSPRNQSYFVDDVVVARDYIGAAPGDADGVEPRLRR
ncbi:MAG TPA: FecR domain-containing protein [Planctomycetota bacterium]|nr:FecR domain-containing protein [Planctomycetota bacterium]